ncbi:MAG: hypothetical protein HY711_02620 [Candidatus Melainabacteria bacterium]|nr:hypothetical protein [Candidatus Melainabacteria bacterium]
MALGLCQFVLGNYSPYPVPRPGVLDKVGTLMLMGATLSPTPPRDLWGQTWIVSTIDKAEGSQPVWLNVMPNTAQINVHTLERVAYYLHSPIRPTTSRLWTPLGDSVEYSQKSIHYFDWFLVKSGDQGTKLRDQASVEAYQSIEKYICSSDSFALAASYPLPDGSALSLYRKIR